MKAKSNSLLGAILIAAAVIATAGVATVGGAVLSAGAAEARALSASQPRRIVKPERKIDPAVLRREGVKKHLLHRDLPGGK